MTTAEAQASAIASAREHFHQLSLERRVARDGCYTIHERLNLLHDLTLLTPQIRSSLLSIFPGGHPMNIDIISGGNELTRAAALHTIMLEVMVTIVLEVELEACVSLLESLKFWRSLAQMAKLRRRYYYPTLHLREGGIRRTSLRRAARLDSMLNDRVTKVGQLHALLQSVRALSDGFMAAGGTAGRHKPFGHQSALTTVTTTVHTTVHTTTTVADAVADGGGGPTRAEDARTAAATSSTLLPPQAHAVSSMLQPNNASGTSSFTHAPSSFPSSSTPLRPPLRRSVSSSSRLLDIIDSVVVGGGGGGGGRGNSDGVVGVGGGGACSREGVFTSTPRTDVSSAGGGGAAASATEVGSPVSVFVSARPSSAFLRQLDAISTQAHRAICAAVADAKAGAASACPPSIAHNPDVPSSVYRPRTTTAAATGTSNQVPQLREQAPFGVPPHNQTAPQATTQPDENGQESRVQQQQQRPVAPLSHLSGDLGGSAGGGSHRFGEFGSRLLQRARSLSVTTSLPTTSAPGSRSSGGGDFRAGTRVNSSSTRHPSPSSPRLHYSSTSSMDNSSSPPPFALTTAEGEVETAAAVVPDTEPRFPPESDRPPVINTATSLPARTSRALQSGGNGTHGCVGETGGDAGGGGGGGGGAVSPASSSRASSLPLPLGRSHDDELLLRAATPRHHHWQRPARPPDYSPTFEALPQTRYPAAAAAEVLFRDGGRDAFSFGNSGLAVAAAATGYGTGCVAPPPPPFPRVSAVHDVGAGGASGQNASPASPPPLFSPAPPAQSSSPPALVPPSPPSSRVPPVSDLLCQESSFLLGWMQELSSTARQLTSLSPPPLSPVPSPVEPVKSSEGGASDSGGGTGDKSYSGTEEAAAAAVAKEAELKTRGGVDGYFVRLSSEATLRTMGTAAQPSRIARMWPWFSITALCLGVGVVVALRNKEKGKVIAGWLRENARDFWRDHVATPAREIIDELVFNRRTRITDRVALTDSVTSLKRMLFEFMRDTMKDMPLEEVQRKADSLDMSVVSSKFELELPSAVWNLGFGEVARIMLIQVQFIKKELLVAMSAIEDLMDANNFNFRVMATVPAFLVAASGVFGIRFARSYLLGHHTRDETYASLRVMILDLERALSRMTNHQAAAAAEAAIQQQQQLQQHPHPHYPEAEADEVRAALLQEQEGQLQLQLQQEQQRCLLRDEGLLLAFGWRFRKTVHANERLAWSTGARFQIDEALSLHADLDEVFYGCLPLQQRLDAVRRISSSYRFLLRAGIAHVESAYAFTFLK